jgi:hypothetical protein
VSPFLFQIDRNEVKGPLLQFQSTIFEHDDVLKLVKSINSACDPSLEDVRLEAIFAVWWPTLESRLKDVSLAGNANGELDDGKRSVEDVLDEVLTLVRAQQKIITDPTELLPRDYIEYIFRSSELADRMVVDAVSELETLARVIRHEATRLGENAENEEFSTLAMTSRELGLIVGHLANATGSRRRRQPPRKSNRPTVGTTETG